MTVVETRVSVWEALAGRAPGVPSGPADPGLWHAVVERLNPARARPVLRQGIVGDFARERVREGVSWLRIQAALADQACLFEPEQAAAITETREKYAAREEAAAAQAEEIAPAQSGTASSTEPAKRFILCPKCGERIWL